MLLCSDMTYLLDIEERQTERDIQILMDASEAELNNGNHIVAHDTGIPIQAAHCRYELICRLDPAARC